MLRELCDALGLTDEDRARIFADVLRRNDFRNGYGVGSDLCLYYRLTDEELRQQLGEDQVLEIEFVD